MEVRKMEDFIYKRFYGDDNDDGDDGDDEDMLD